MMYFLRTTAKYAIRIPSKWPEVLALLFEPVFNVSDGFDEKDFAFCSIED